MKTLTCIEKIKNKCNMVCTYILQDENGEITNADRKTVVSMLRNAEEYTFTNLQLTFNNRVMHMGPLKTKARYTMKGDKGNV